MTKLDILGTIKSVFELADEKLLEENQWCKHTCLDERNLMHDVEQILIELVNGHYKENI